MHLGNNRNKHTYTMAEEVVRRELDEVLEEKDLGVKFDPTLLFSKYIATKKANSMVDIIRRTFWPYGWRNVENYVQNTDQTTCRMCQPYLDPTFKERCWLNKF